jgi:hypothetical protein
MTTQSLKYGLNAVTVLLQTLFAVGKLIASPVTTFVEKERERKLILVGARPVKAYSDCTGYKEASIETRTIVDPRGRVLAQVKLWIYLDERMCYREVTFLNALLRTSVGLNRVPFQPLTVGKGDTPAALLEVTVRDFEGWLRKRTPGTQFGVEAARAAAAKLVELKVASMPPPVAKPAVVEGPLPIQKQEVKTPAPAQRPVPVKTNLKPVVEEVVMGIMIDYGIQKRSIGTRTFEQFCVDLTLTDAENSGKPHRVWGTDLQRCVEEARSKRGDKVEIQKHGSLPMQLNGGATSQKNCFTMLVMP